MTGVEGVRVGEEAPVLDVVLGWDAAVVCFR